MRYLSLVLAGAGLATAAVAQAPAPAPYCETLMDQYARYARFAPPGEGSSAPGQVEREIGEQRCREGRTDEAELLLAKAVEALGFAPLPRPRRE